MKFGQTLSSHLTPEWRKQYITYPLLKRMIYNAIESLSEEIQSDPMQYKMFIAQFDEEFFMECENELLKIDSFFAEKLAEAKRKFQEMRVELDYLMHPHGVSKRISKIDLLKSLPKPKAKHLKFVMSEFYLSLILLQNYQTLNHTGFRKILKKHDKNLKVTTGQVWFKTNLEKAVFATNTEIKQLIKDTETLFTMYLEGGDRSKAMKRLRVPPFEELQSPWRTFRLGLLMGAFICIFGYIILTTLTNLQISGADFEIIQHLHRPLILLTFFLFLMGLNVYGWQKSGVNHILIFEIDPRDHLTATHFLEIAAFLALLSALSFLSCIHMAEYLPRFAYPLMLAAAFALFWLNPFPLQWSSRYWLMRVVGRIFCAPFFQVGFADFWLADQLTSLSLMFSDYGFFACFYATNSNLHAVSHANKQCGSPNANIMKAILFSIPAWCRFAQCLRRYYDQRTYFRFLVNAGKYASMFPVNGFQAALANNAGNFSKVEQNPFFWYHLISRIINTTVCYLWDIIMDFGLFRKFSSENIFLRDELLYTPCVYYLAVIEDLILRLYWVFALLLNSNNIMSAFNIATLGGFLEIIRRYIWNFFRLENEHLNNAGRFRAVRDISVVPLTSDDQKRMEYFMDENDGVKNRKHSKSDEDDDDYYN